MGFDEGQIILDRENGAYYAGQIVHGRVVFPQDKAKVIHGIYVDIKGFCKVHWTTTRSRRVNGRSVTDTVHHGSQEEYFRNKYFLFGNENGEHTLKPGQHEFAFSCPIPPNCPASFEGSYGHIRYRVKVVMVTTGIFSLNKDKWVPVKVHAPVDLNQIPYCREPMEFELSSSYCCWCVSAGSSEVTVRMPVSGYCPGQVIPVEVSCQNDSSVDIEIRLAIKRYVKFTAVSEPGTRRDHDTVAEIKKGPIPGRTTRNWTVEMEVPALDIYNVEACSFIDIDYQFKVSTEVGSCHRDNDETLPIIFGTVPIVGFQDNVLNPLRDQLPQSMEIQNVPGVNSYPAPPIINQPMPTSYPNSNDYPPPYPGGFPTTPNLGGRTSPYPPENQPYPNASPYPPIMPYPGANSPYPCANSPYPGANSPYPGANSPYPGANPPYPSEKSPYPGTNPPYPSEKSPYPPGNSPYPPGNSPHPPGNSPYPPGNSPYPPEKSPIPPASAPFSTDNSLGINHSPYPGARQSPVPRTSAHPSPIPPYPGAGQSPIPPTSPLKTETVALGSTDIDSATAPLLPAGANLPIPPGNSPYPPGNPPYPTGNSPYPPEKSPIPPATTPSSKDNSLGIDPSPVSPYPGAKQSPVPRNSPLKTGTIGFVATEGDAATAPLLPAGANVPMPSANTPDSTDNSLGLSPTPVPPYPGAHQSPAPRSSPLKTGTIGFGATVGDGATAPLLPAGANVPMPSANTPDSTDNSLGLSPTPVPPYPGANQSPAPRSSPLKTGTIGFGATVGDGATAPLLPAGASVTYPSSPYATASAPEPSTPGDDEQKLPLDGLTGDNSPYNPNFIEESDKKDEKETK